MGLLVTWAAVVTLCLVLAQHSTLADGNIGCVFSSSLCVPGVEWCFHDEAFGRCLQDNADKEDMYRYDLNKYQLHKLEVEMDKLLNFGYRWSHGYTQCILQAILYSFKMRTEFEGDVCDNLKDDDLSTALAAFENDQALLNPNDYAHFEDVPSSDEHPVYAEVFYPQENAERVSAFEQHHREDTNPYEYKFPEADSELVREYKDDSEMARNFLQKKSYAEPRALHFSQNYNTPDDFRNGFESKDLISEYVKDALEFLNQEKELTIENEPQDKIRQQWGLPMKDEADDRNYLLLPMGAVSPNSRRQSSRLLDVLSNRMAEEKGEVARGYTEGGLVLIPDKHPNVDQRFSEFLVGLNSDINWGFKRPERLDVKKPGPPFKTNSYAFKSMKDELIEVVPQKKTYSTSDIDTADSDQYNFVFVKFKETLGNWSQGVRIVKTIANLLRIPKGSFDEIRVDRNEVTFRVLPNEKNLNASTVAKEIEKIKDILKEGLKVTVTSAGIGDKWRSEEQSIPTKPEDHKEKKHKKPILEHKTVKIEEDLLPEPLVMKSMKDELIEVVPQKKTYSTSDIDMAGSDQYDIVNTNFAFVEFKEILTNWNQGARIIETIANLLRIPKESFGEIRVDRNEVTFRVLPNEKNLNASTVAKEIVKIKDILKKQLKVTVTSAGIGDKTKLTAVRSLDENDEFLAAVFVVSLVLVALILSATTFVLIRRYSTSRAKIQSLTTPDTEASKDYQELCRARMAAKPPHDTAAPTPPRIASLSRESDNSPSSRSSTSSWNEEPALSSMDISTGHMVLSYMEDHLRNKDRLETEWAALCAYEADPCATIIAQRLENAKKNRYVNALPYDHARVVLNELSNISGSDYINASTITDHDPRNPAYIATQGALTHTAPDLWQMVWEQGCVVMVMLTRLIENEVSMCHRYWPEEGSELYHIYEVHLVSEHFWCDDYLVRSFYLKNLSTSETRTVTQFHFMSWPEGGVPASTKALLEFRRKVNKSFRGRSCPIVVHCSDGVGRTGTYCLLDMVLNRMAKGAKEIDIAATLEHIRDQRGGSVATKQQFQFVLAAVAEEVQAILRILPQQKQDSTPSTQQAQ